MAGRKMDRVGAKTALETMRESPMVTAVVMSPAVVLFVLAWVLAGFGWAIVTLVVLGTLAVAGFHYS
jgi:hypothetical protein